MKSFTSILCLLSLPVMMMSQGRLVLPEGTVIRMNSQADMGSKINQTGDVVYFEVAEDLESKGEVVVPAGTKVVGTVTKSKRAKLAGTNSKFEISVDYLALANGENIRLRANKELDNQEDKQILVIGAAVLVSPLFLLFKGKEVVIPSGTQFEALLAEDILANN